MGKRGTMMRFGLVLLCVVNGEMHDDVDLLVDCTADSVSHSS